MITKFSKFLIFQILISLLASCSIGGAGTTPDPMTLQGLEINPNGMNISSGTSQQLTVIAYYANSKTQESSDVTNQVIWNSYSSNISSMNDSGMVSCYYKETQGLYYGMPVSATYNGVSTSDARLTCG
ncbi:MAG: hypothetical protein K2P99_01910 [Burkholderiales bacterium]|nr:hypothetical protein [Burkholderiales bacterium]